MAKMLRVNRNSISSWARDPRILELVERFQSDIEHKLEDMSIEATRRKHDQLIVQAVQKLEAMLTSKSTRRQLEAIKLLLAYGELHESSQYEQPQGPQEGQTRIRLSPELRPHLKVTQS
jgi:hypothetical protein